VWENKGEFKDLLLADEDIASTLGADAIEKLFDLSHHLKFVDNIFERVF
jgi:adenylosuccinate lyase